MCILHELCLTAVVRRGPERVQVRLVCEAWPPVVRHRRRDLDEEDADDDARGERASRQTAATRRADAASQVDDTVVNVLSRGWPASTVAATVAAAHEPQRVAADENDGGESEDDESEDEGQAAAAAAELLRAGGLASGRRCPTLWAFSWREAPAAIGRMAASACRPRHYERPDGWVTHARTHARTHREGGHAAAGS
jgi:hypothetical protein